jgi:endogenous inhibitor of DNA gyrase (YacG/DUF329 family)
LPCSFSAVRRQLFLGLPRLLCPCGFHSKAFLGTESVPFLRVWPKPAEFSPSNFQIDVCLVSFTPKVYTRNFPGPRSSLKGTSESSPTWPYKSQRHQAVDLGRAMAQAVSCRPPTAEARVRSRVSPCGICGGQSGTQTGFSPSTSVFPCQFHSTGAPLLGKGQKIIIIIVIFIIGLHKKPQGCGASVASAAGPFTLEQT